MKRLLVLAIAMAMAASFATAQELSPARIAQKILVERGYDIGGVDGIWGRRSIAAMTDLQRRLGLPQTGQPDAVTLKALTTPAASAPPEAIESQPLETVKKVDGTSAPPQVEQPSRVEKPLALPPSAIRKDLLEVPPDLVIDSAVVPEVAPNPARTEVPSTNLSTKAPEKVRTGTMLLDLLFVVGLPAFGVYLFFRSRKRRQQTRMARAEPTSLSAAPPSQQGTTAARTASVNRRAEPPRQEARQRSGGTGAANQSLRQHNAAVDEFVRSRTAVSQFNRIEIDLAQAVAAELGSSTPPPRPRPDRSSAWVPADQPIAVGSHRLTRGLVYVGEQLKPQNGWGQRDNCLIVPSLPVASRADVSGQHLDYWPSYERLSPSSRKAYLDWLASDRSNPGTPIGYVFLYFYGLERRLMLDRTVDDRDVIIAEVERLISIYGENHSFRRYSAELLSTARAFEPAVDRIGEPIIGLGDLPIADKLQLGRRAAMGQTVPPTLLLSLAANHPETRLRAPVRRLPHLVAQRFCSRVEQDFPNGLIVTLPRRVPALEIAYRAASSTFEVPIVGGAQGVPDIAQLPEPLGYARNLLESISEELDSYSRELGRSNGAPATIAGLSKLPPDLRHQQAAALAGEAMERLGAIADSRQLHGLKDLLALVGLKTDVSTKIGLRDLSRCLINWGLGIVPDPHFVPKILADQDGVLVFRFDMTRPVGTESSEEYRLTYVSLALGVVIAKSDGKLSEVERRLLFRLILETPELSDEERQRLTADLVWLETNPLAVSDLRQHLRESTPEFRTALMTRLISVAAADGVMDGGEVAVLEKLAKTLSLDPSVIYQQLHSIETPGDCVPMVVAPGLKVEHTIPAEPRPATSAFDAARLAAIRAETALASSILGEIFDDDEEISEPELPPPAIAAGELDQRHRALLDELSTRQEWARADFERLVRQAGLMPGSVISKLNDWSIDRCDELVLEGDDPVVVNSSVVLESA